MKKIKVIMLLLLLAQLPITSQNIIRGVVLEADSEEPFEGVSIYVEDLKLSQITKRDGSFMVELIPNGEQLITISFDGYEKQKYLLKLIGKTIDLGIILLHEDVSIDQDLSTITITEDELNNDASTADNISGLLQASRDVYLKTAAFEWSPSFYSVRGLDSENGKVMINGIEMNKLYNGKPQWSNWGGLNDIFKYQEYSNGLTPSNYGFGGVLGSVNMNTRASDFKKGIRISYASSNRSYSHRIMGTYTSGLLNNGWAIAVSGSRRSGEEGYIEGTFYEGNSFFISLEKKLNDYHSLNLSIISANNKRGKSSPNTQEVFDLKGIKYNPYWGYQNNKARNSRIRDLYEPILMLNHFWRLSDNTTLNSNLSFQTGREGNSRINFNGARLVNGWPIGGGSNPDPTYYQKLPSYAIRNGSRTEYNLLQEFLNDGQWDWDEMIRQNLAGNESTNSKYILYEDRNDEDQFSANTIFFSELNEHIVINSKLHYTQIKSENFANLLDLLGGQGFLDVDTFGDNLTSKQNNLRNPNRIVTEGDRFNYNYILKSKVLSAFLQAQFKYNKVNFYVAGDASKTSHQREGLYQSGAFKNNSLGKSEKLEFTNFGFKGGFTYKVSGRHLLDFNGGYLTKAPTIRNTFSNPRETNNAVLGLVTEKIMSNDISYILRFPTIQAKLTGYYVGIKDATEISFFYVDGINGNNSAFIQEVITEIEKKHLGIEIGIEAQITPSIKLKGATNIGQYTFHNNPMLYLTSDADNQSHNDSEYFLRPTTSYLKNYRVASGPQKAYSLGFEYRDPDFWWFGATVNYLDDVFVDISPLRRTQNFVVDEDGIEFSDYDPLIARDLLDQEEFENYMVVNAIGGKSWKLGDYYVGFFASLNNLFNKKYKSGGFEQGRNANYRVSKKDSESTTPVFGNKYWYGRGTTFFINVYFRF
ncbi:carboxypeptidase-like regulatory domain-containing protein [Tenacibaculum sp. C7A-26P2]|uniref:carboxypeptidase-like regulatory domain-containing protein n=1 Tax=Tenacibaculum sp. C7A-26P2 TaxID=3447504 RepID=UPI003F856CE7